MDAPNTAYAPVLYTMPQLNGLRKGDYAVKPIGGTALRLGAMRKDRSYAAAMMDPRFSVLAEKDGFRRLGPAVQTIGSYQARSTFVLRSWARGHGDVEAMALLAERLKLSSDVAEKSYEAAVDPVEGFASDAKFDADGFKNTLQLRAEPEDQWGGSPPPAEKSFDLSYYEQALAGL